MTDDITNSDSNTDDTTITDPDTDDTRTTNPDTDDTTITDSDTDDTTITDPNTSENNAGHDGDPVDPTTPPNPETGDWRPSDPTAPTPTDADLTAVRDLAPSLTREPLAIPGVLVIAATFVLVTPAGIVPAAAVVALWALTSPIYAGTAAALFVGTLELSGASQLLVAVGVVAVLLVPVLRYRPRAPALIGTVGAGVLTGAVVYGGLQAEMVELTALLLITVVGIVGYSLHRYSLLQTVYRDSS